MKEDIKILEDLAETLNKTCENGICEASMSIENLIKAYRELEKKNKRYEKIYKEYGIDDLVRKIERLEEDNEDLKRLANNKQWISPCYVAQNYIPKSKVKELHKEYYEKAFAEPYDCTTADYKHSQVIGGWRALNKLLMED